MAEPPHPIVDAERPAALERLEAALLRSPAMVLEWRLTDGWPVELASENVRRLGYTSEDLLDHETGWLALVHPEDAPRLESEIRQCVEKDARELRQRYRILTKDGDTRWVTVFARPQVGAGGEATKLTGVVLDVTDQRAAEEGGRRCDRVLQEAQQTRALVTLAGGVAHQFNNALSVITGHLGLIEEDHAGEPDPLDQISQMRESAERMARLTNQLLAYAQGGRYNPTPLHLSSFVREALPCLARKLPPSVELTTDLADDLSTVVADDAQLRMVLSALLSNACEALGATGTVHVSTRDARAGEVPGTEPRGRWVCLEVHDDGEGMDETTLERLFEPFFSTRFHGRGLGMAAVYGVVKNHKGRIDVTSQPGQGTTVSIYLPATELPTEAAKSRETPSSAVKPVVLVVDDEELVLEVYVTLFERLGFEALQSMTGAGAVKIAETHPGPIELALVDLILPDMDAMSVFEGIRAARPDTKILICSGFSQEGPAQEVLDAGADGFIQKPFNLARLREKIEELRDGAPRRG